MEKYLPSQVLKAAGVLAARVSLEQVSIKEAYFNKAGNWEPETHPDINELSQSFTSEKYSFEESSNCLNVEVVFETKMQSPTEGAPGFEIRALFLACYRLNTTPPPPDLYDLFFGSFSKSNALLNVWPYWREFASSCNDRMALPHWNVPVLRIVPEPADDKQEAKKKTNSSEKTPKKRKETPKRTAKKS